MELQIISSLIETSAYLEEVFDAAWAFVVTWENVPVFDQGHLRVNFNVPGISTIFFIFLLVVKNSDLYLLHVEHIPSCPGNGWHYKLRCVQLL